MVGLYGGVYAVSRGKASLKWPTAKGVIRQSEVSVGRSSGSSGTSYGFKVKYEFEVDGSLYAGDTYSFQITTNSANDKGAKALVEEYPNGSLVDVYYNPKDPRVCVLLPGVNGWSYMGFGVGLVFLLAGIAIVMDAQG